MKKNSSFTISIGKFPTSILVVDPSSSHLAYTIMTFKSAKDVEIEKCGMLWAQDKWSRGRKFHYIYKCMQALMHSIPKIEAIVTEAFFANPRMLGSASSIPTVNGIIEMVADMNSTSEVGYPVDYLEIPPTHWRKIINLKPVVIDGSKDYKKPAKDIVIAHLGKLPETIISNVTGNARELPHDITDCLAISIAVAKFLGYTDIRMSNTAFNNKEDLDLFKELVIK
jgi:hypothetical protein